MQWTDERLKWEKSKYGQGAVSEDSQVQKLDESFKTPVKKSNLFESESTKSGFLSSKWSIETMILARKTRQNVSSYRPQRLNVV